MAAPKRPAPAKPAPPSSPEQDALKAEIRAITQQLLTAKPKEVYDLTMELQRRRVGLMITRELDWGEVDPTTYKEINLLNRLLAGSGLENRADISERAEVMSKAEEKLAPFGVTKENAPGIVRALEAVMKSPSPKEPDGLADSAPDGPQSTH